MEEDESKTLERINDLEMELMRDYDMTKEDVHGVLLENLDDDATEAFVKEFRLSTAYVEFLDILKSSFADSAVNNNSESQVASESPKDSKPEATKVKEEAVQGSSKASHVSSSKSKKKDAQKDSHSHKKHSEIKSEPKDSDKKKHKHSDKKDRKDSEKKEHKKDGEIKKEHRKDGAKKEHKKDVEKKEHKKDVEFKKEPTETIKREPPNPPSVSSAPAPPIFKSERTLQESSFLGDKKFSTAKIEIKPKMHPYYFKFEKIKKLKPCSIVVCDLKLLGKCLATQKLKESTKLLELEPIKIDKEKQKELYKEEKLRRLHFERVVTINWKAIKKETDKERLVEERRDKERQNRLKKQKELNRRAEEGEREAKRKKRIEAEKKAKAKAESNKYEIIKDNKYDANGVRILPFEKKKHKENAIDNQLSSFSKTAQEKYKKIQEEKEKRKEREIEERKREIQRRVEENLKAKAVYKIPKIEKKPEVTSTTRNPLPNYNRERMNYDPRRPLHKRPNRPVIEEDPPPIIVGGKAWECDEDDYAPSHEPEEEVEIEHPDVIRPLEGEIKVNKMAVAVETFLKEPHKLKYPVDDSAKGMDLNTEHAVAWKMSWWYLQSMIDPHQLTLPFAPELEERPDSDEEEDDARSVESFFGNVSDEGEVGCQSNVISSSIHHDPDKLDEYCGCNLLESQIRIGDFKENKFLALFSTRPGTNYEKASFQSQCNICNDLIVGKKSLGAHVRSQAHKENIIKLSLDRVPENQRVVSGMHKRDKIKTDPIMAKERDDDIISHTSGGLPIKIPGRCLSKTGSEKEKRKRSRSRTPLKLSRSPHGSKNRGRSRSPRRRSKSPRRRSRSRSRGRKRSRSPKHRRRSPSPKRRQKSKSPSRSNASTLGSLDSIKLFNKNEFCLRLTLTSEGKWPQNIQERWTCAEIEADRVFKEYAQMRRNYTDKPEDHPKYSKEWEKFWETRRAELESQGEDAEGHDYFEEWRVYWPKRCDVIYKLELEEKVKEIKENHLVDYDSLLRLRFPNATPGMHPGVSRPIAIENTYVKPPIKPLTPQKDQKGKLSLDDIYSPTPMSISANSNGSNSGPSKPLNPVTATDVTKLWQTLMAEPKTTPVACTPLPTAKIPDHPLPTKSLPKTSSVASSSYASLNVEGLDLLGVLQLVKNLEDQLSILAPKVEEYWSRAEKLDIQKHNKSNSLLEDEEFVHLLHHCRNRFNTLIREGIGSKEVIKQMNLATYSLNEVLSHDLCEKFKPPSAPYTLQVESMPTSVPQPTPAMPPRIPEMEKPSQVVQKPEAVAGVQETLVASALRNVSMKCKEDIAWALARAIIDIGLENMTDLELGREVDRLFKPILGNWESGSRSEGHETREGISHFRRNTPGLETTNLPLAPISTSGSSMSNEPIRTPGTALPRLQLPEVRAVTPPRVPLPQSAPKSQSQTTGGNNRVSEGGRRSPFSQRDFSWNPDKKIWERKEDKRNEVRNEVRDEHSNDKESSNCSNDDIDDEDLFVSRGSRPTQEIQKSKKKGSNRYSSFDPMSLYSGLIEPMAIPKQVPSSHHSPQKSHHSAKMSRHSQPLLPSFDECLQPTPPRNENPEVQSPKFRNEKINITLTEWGELEEPPVPLISPVVIPSILPTAEDLGMDMDIASKMPLGIYRMVVDEKLKRQKLKADGEEGELESEKDTNLAKKSPNLKRKRDRESSGSGSSPSHDHHRRKKSKDKKDRKRRSGHKKEKHRHWERSRDHERHHDHHRRNERERGRSWKERDSSPVSSILSNISNLSYGERRRTTKDVTSRYKHDERRSVDHFKKGDLSPISTNSDISNAHEHRRSIRTAPPEIRTAPPEIRTAPPLEKSSMDCSSRDRHERRSSSCKIVESRERHRHRSLDEDDKRDKKGERNKSRRLQGHAERFWDENGIEEKWESIKSKESRKDKKFHGTIRERKGDSRHLEPGEIISSESG